MIYFEHPVLGLWKTVYDEYRRIGYRLDNQPTLFD